MAKVDLERLSPFRHTLYIDADTRIHGSVAAGFRFLGEGYDIAIAPSTVQGGDILWHVSDEERTATITESGYQPL